MAGEMLGRILDGPGVGIGSPGLGVGAGLVLLGAGVGVGREARVASTEPCGDRVGSGDGA